MERTEEITGLAVGQAGRAEMGVTTGAVELEVGTESHAAEALRYATPPGDTYKLYDREGQSLETTVNPGGGTPRTRGKWLAKPEGSPFRTPP